MMKNRLHFCVVLFFLNITLLLAQSGVQHNVGNETSSSPLMMTWERPRDNRGQGDHREEQRRPLLQREQDDLEQHQVGTVELVERVPGAVDEADDHAREPQINEQDQQLINALKRNRARKTMAALKAIDVCSRTDLSSSLWALITGRMTTTQALQAVLIFNDRTTPFYLRIPASGTQARFSTLAPMIVPVGFPTYLEDGSQGPVVPNRVPTAEENQQIRKLIKDTLDIYYGCNVPERMAQLDPTLRNFYESLDASESRDRVLTVGEIQFLLPSNHEEEQSGDVEVAQGEAGANNDHPEIRLPEDLEPIPEHIGAFARSIANHPDVDQLIDFSQTNPTDERLRGDGEQVFGEIDRRLSSPWQSLGKIFWKRAEARANQGYLFFRSAYKEWLLPAFAFSIYGGMVGGFISSISLRLMNRPDRVINILDYNCTNDRPLLNRTIDIRDHLIGLNMYKDYAELRYRTLNQTSPQFQTSPQSLWSGIGSWENVVDWSSIWKNGTEYQKALVSEFCSEDHLVYLHHNVYYHYPSSLPGYVLPYYSRLTTEVDWVYANLAEPDSHILIEERTKYEKELAERYQIEKQGIKKKFYATFLNRNLIFDSRLHHQTLLITKRDELKRNMTPVIREYRGLDIPRCLEMIDGQYKRAMADREREKNKKDQEDQDRFQFGVIAGLCSGFVVGSSMAFLDVLSKARRERDPLIQNIDRAFYEAAQAAEEVKEHLGLGTEFHQQVLDSLRQAQQHDEQLANIVRSIFTNIEQHQEVGGEAQAISGATILRAITARIAHRAGFIRELERRIRDFNRRRGVLAFAR